MIQQPELQLPTMMGFWSLLAQFISPIFIHH